ncbi:hypothetical protein NFI96_001672 [Prochilodus magdalenae]|nr:hypothetical protein NFI96_001672 [Prochilodus magdalenae]
MQFLILVISSDMKEDHIFRLTGKGADQDPKGVFSINKITGEVAVSRALDREAIPFYHSMYPMVVYCSLASFHTKINKQRKVGPYNFSSCAKGTFVLLLKLDQDQIPTPANSRPVELQVSTTDMSGKLVEGPVDLDVYVIDQNDNRPIFRESRYSGEVLEGSPTVSTIVVQNVKRDFQTALWRHAQYSHGCASKTCTNNLSSFEL